MQYYQGRPDAPSGIERLTSRPALGRFIMATTDSSAPAAARPVRRRWIWPLLAAAVLLSSGLLGLEGWAYWQERSARRAMAEEHFDEAHQRIDLALLVRERWTSTQLLAARIDRVRGAYSE